MRRPFIPLLAQTTLAAATLLLAAGCGGPPIPPPPPDAPVGYLQLREAFGPRDFAPLAGRRVVIDPGHGGRFRGALGPGGLAEADVNLGVALHLRGLLEWSGAEAILTRTADYDFLTPADSTLASDLAFRVSFTDSMQPDVFLSIHHNSTATADPTINETQTYYPLGDDGASLDLARAIHRHLVLNLEISPARILPGNFHVLREATVPAVLGEPAMISHPMMEGRLTQAAAQRLEAEAYFLGLLDYFKGGDPRWQPAQPDTVTVPAGGLTLAWTLADGRPGAPRPDPTSFAVRVDGRPAAAALSADGATVSWFCPEAAGGPPQVVTVDGRNLAGRRAPTAVTVLRPAPATLIALEILNDPPTAAPQRAHLQARTPDGRPLPTGALGWPDVAGGLLLTGGSATAAGPVTRGAGAAVFQPTQDGSASLAIVETTLPDSLRLLPAPGPDDPWRSRLAPTRPLVGAVITGSGAPCWFEAAGYQPLAATGAARADLAATPAVRDLRGVRVVIDPAGGGPETDGAGPLGLRGADVNLAVARRLADLLAGCGAQAILTRDEGDVPTPTAKVALAGAAGADLFLTIGRSTDGSVAVRHHPGSVGGQAWAARTVRVLGRLLPASPVAAEASWSYLLRHTACPALEVRLPGPLDAAAELRLDQAAWQAAEARALLLAVAGQRAGADLETIDPATILPLLAGAPTAGDVAWARWDGNLAWFPLPAQAGPPSDGSVCSWGEPGLPAGGPVHHLEVHDPGGWQLWRLARDADGRWSGELLFHGPTRE